MKVFLVGGAVRDTLLGKQPKDRDWVVVGATPKDLLDKGFEQVGASFPVFLHPETGEEYALARTERKVGAGYHGFEVAFDPTVTIEDDLARRDFTINAMAMDPETGEIIDPFGGRADLESCLLRHTSEAFSEDPLRVVRLARFAAQLDAFSITKETRALALKMVRDGQLNELPPERLAGEVRKVLRTCTGAGCRIFFHILNGLDAGEHVTFFRDIDLRWTALVAEHARLWQTEEHRHVVVAALITRSSATREHLGGAIAREVGRALDALRDKGRTTASLLTVLRQAGAWTDAPTWRPLLAALATAEQLGAPGPVSSDDLALAAALTTPFGEMGAKLAAEGMPGAEIGRTISEARARVLRALNLS